MKIWIIEDYLLLEWLWLQSLLVGNWFEYCSATLEYPAFSGYDVSHLGNCGISIRLTEEDVDQRVGHPHHPADDVADDGDPGKFLCFGVNLHEYCGGESADQEDDQYHGHHQTDPPLLLLLLSFLGPNQLIQMLHRHRFNLTVDIF